MTVATILDIIRRRRTIKPAQFEDRDIPDDVLRTILESANWAPTHGHTEPWRFQVFSGSARRRLADFLATTYQAITPESDFKEQKFEKLQRNPTLAPLVVAVCMKRQDIEKIPEIVEVLKSVD